MNDSLIFHEICLEPHTYHCMKDRNNLPITAPKFDILKQYIKIGYAKGGALILVIMS